jgi:hypothetical protein
MRTANATVRTRSDVRRMISLVNRSARISPKPRETGVYRAQNGRHGNRNLAAGGSRRRFQPAGSDPGGFRPNRRAGPNRNRRPPGTRKLGRDRSTASSAGSRADFCGLNFVLKPPSSG